jgi:phage terminase large subunit GpA-like protein
MRVYEFVRSRPPGTIRAIKGQDDLPMAIGAPKRTEFRKNDGKRLKRGVRLWPVGTNLLKTEVMGRLKLRRPTDTEIEESGFPPMYVHFPMLDEEYFKQVTAEQLILTPTVRGHAEYKWVKTYPNNEALDLLCYNIAAWHGAGAHKMTDDDWRELEAQVGVKSGPKSEPTSEVTPAAAEHPRKRRGDFWS